MEVEARIEPGSLRKLLRMSRDWDAASRREMRAGLRTAAMRGANAAKSEVLGAPPDNGAIRQRSTGLRRGLAGGVSVSLQSGRLSTKTGAVTGEGVRVVTTGKKLSAGKEPMVKAYMAREWRHPVFGSSTYVTQRGKDWFYKPLITGRDEYQRAIAEAIAKATRAIAN